MTIHKDLLKLFKDFESRKDDSNYALKKQCDRLAGFVHVALKQLEDEGRVDFLLLKHDDMRHWWHSHKQAIQAQQDALAEKQRKAELKARALARLTEEEKVALGLKK